LPNIEVTFLPKMFNSDNACSSYS